MRTAIIFFIITYIDMQKGYDPPMDVWFFVLLLSLAIVISVLQDIRELTNDRQAKS